MATSRIDLDRGVSIRQVVRFDEGNRHKFEPDEKYGGLTVHMYKDTPGVYFDVHGNPLPDAIAKRAGFPVERLAKSRAKREAMNKFEQRLAEELALEADEEIILAQDGNWKVVALPMERAKVVDVETGEPVTAVPMTRADALLFLQELTGTAAEVEAAANDRKGKSNGSQTT